MVVCLQQRAFLALGEYDECVQDFVELGHVKQPAVEGQTRVPDTPNVGGVRRDTVGTKSKSSIGDRPGL